MEQPVKKNKFSYFARSRLRLRPQEILRTRLEDPLYVPNSEDERDEDEDFADFDSCLYE